ncbi:MAG: pilus assembly protein [Proteobacteria bacterium]|nr:pilus assembly protein [Pseudomonadota bacterium]
MHENPTRRLIAPLARGLRRCAAWHRGKARQLAGRQDGAAAVEFAIVMAPFLALVFAIMESAIVFFAGQTLETAVADSARLIMTGQAQTGGFNQAKFKDEACKRIFALFNCSTGMYVDVRTYNTFSSISSALPIDANGNLVNNFTYSPGGPGDIVVVRLMYQWPVYVSLLGLNLSDMAGGKRLLVATAAFRNEPY